MSHRRAADGTVLCEHEDAHDDLHALVVKPVSVPAYDDDHAHDLEHIDDDHHHYHDHEHD